MATTESRSGFRLPWSVDRSSSTDASGDAEPGRDPGNLDEPAAVVEDQPLTPTESESPDGSAVPAENEPATTGTDATATDATGTDAIVPPAPIAKLSRRPSKFLADLMTAMHAAAEQAHVAALEQFQGDGRSVVDGIQARSAEQADGLRRRSDEDIAGIKDWSKAEIARIREETEARIVARKAQLDVQLERHAALVEREIGKVRTQLAAFERDMEAFFAELVQVEDPSEFAARAEQMPEPPAFEPLDEDTLGALLDEPIEPLATAESTQEAAASALDAPGAGAQVDEGEPGVASVEDPFDRETAMAAIQAAAEAAASFEAAQASADRAEVAADRAEVAFELIDHETGLPIEPGQEPGAVATDERAADGADVPSEGEAEVANVDDDGHDPRIAMLGLTPDYAGAEDEAAIEAAALREAAAESEPIQEMGEDTLSARLAGLVGSSPAAGQELGPQVTTQVMVTGLISVASIASFKRHLGRLAGVGHVGVSSGPDGEFVFTAQHDPEVSLRELIPSLPSFQARVTGGGDGTITVSAHDPDA